MGTLSRRFTGAELVPDWWSDLPVTTLEDIVFLGEITIREMIRSWRGTSKDLARVIKSVDGELKLIQGKTAKDIQALAEGYEYPTFTPDQIGERDHNWSHDPEPLDDASTERKHGSTTFNICGWCSHASGGTGRFGYYITTACSFLTDAGLPDDERSIPLSVKRRYGKAEILSWEAVDGQREAAAEAVLRLRARYPDIDRSVKLVDHDGKTRRRFDTPCFLKFARSADFIKIEEGLERRLKGLIQAKQTSDEKIKLLLALIKDAERKPALPDQRPYDWFNIDDPLTCYIGHWDGRIVQDDWATAAVIDGYRHHEGCVSVRYDSRVHDGEYLEGHGGGYGMSRPEVMLTWEFDYLREHPDFAHIWVHGASKHLKGYDPDKLYAAIMPKQLTDSET